MDILSSLAPQNGPEPGKNYSFMGLPSSFEMNDLDRAEICSLCGTGSELVRYIAPCNVTAGAEFLTDPAERIPGVFLKHVRTYSPA